MSGGKLMDKNIEFCNCSTIHEDVVEKVRNLIPPAETLYDLAELFKVFGDTTRTKILYALFQAEMCVCDMAALLGMSQSAISHQLKVLKHTRLVKHRRDGKIVYYSLDDDHIEKLFTAGLEHVRHN